MLQVTLLSILALATLAVKASQVDYGFPSNQNPTYQKFGSYGCQPGHVCPRPCSNKDVPIKILYDIIAPTTWEFPGQFITNHAILTTQKAADASVNATQVMLALVKGRWREVFRTPLCDIVKANIPQLPDCKPLADLTGCKDMTLGTTAYKVCQNFNFKVPLPAVDFRALGIEDGQQQRAYDVQIQRFSDKGDLIFCVHFDKQALKKSQ